ncbi:hypothetical protein SLE2022_216210 [Rubroshorea leprosula]
MALHRFTSSFFAMNSFVLLCKVLLALLVFCFVSKSIPDARRIAGDFYQGCFLVFESPLYSFILINILTIVIFVLPLRTTTAPDTHDEYVRSYWSTSENLAEEKERQIIPADNAVFSAEKTSRESERWWVPPVTQDALALSTVAETKPTVQEQVQVITHSRPPQSCEENSREITSLRPPQSSEGNSQEIVYSCPSRVSNLEENSQALVSSSWPSQRPDRGENSQVWNPQRSDHGQNSQVWYPQTSNHRRNSQEVAFPRPPQVWNLEGNSQQSTYRSPRQGSNYCQDCQKHQTYLQTKIKAIGSISTKHVVNTVGVSKEGYWRTQSVTSKEIKFWLSEKIGYSK